MTAHTLTDPPGDPSWWLVEALSREKGQPQAGPLQGHLKVDVAIVGGGYTGLWTALTLKQRNPGLSVALLEAALCGSGASGKNGGQVRGYWGYIGALSAAMGADAALAVARAGTLAQDGIRAFATARGRDVWWREAGSVRVSAAPAQDVIYDAVRVAKSLGVPDTVRTLSREELANICKSPVFRGGVLYAEGATLHPARLARELRAAVIEAGVQLFENTAMLSLEYGPENRILTSGGEVVARDVVLATNVHLARNPAVKPYVTVFSSYALMTDAAPDRIEAAGWHGNQGFGDGRMFVHYFSKTPDGRVLMGSGSGPISFGGSAVDSKLTSDLNSARRAERGLRRLLPDFNSVRIAKAWGGGIDVSADRLPFFRTVPRTRVHYACGFSGHGVNPTYIAGQCLASLVLDQKDRWTSLPFCTRKIEKLPPEPFRSWGGRAVRWGILSCEEAEEDERSPPLLARATAAMPKVFGLKIGTR